MATQARAWFLYAGTGDDRGELAELRCETFELPPTGAEEVLCEPIYGSFEGNYLHALTRDPVDICRQRGEARVILGNAGVVRILAVGAAVTTLRAGQLAMINGAAVTDRFGYMVQALAYDAPGTMGCLTTRAVLPARCLVPLPEGTRHGLAQWAAFSVRHVTAWANWQLAHATLRSLADHEALPRPHVWGWGGGTTLAELDLARRHGAQAVMISGHPGRLAAIERLGVAALDRRGFAALLDERADRAARKAAEAVFLAAVAERTGGEGVHVFVDYIGTPVHRATLRALGRPGVLATAGWKQGMALSTLRAIECIGHHQHIHTHYARLPQIREAMVYGEASGWMPEVDHPVSFDEIPTLARRFAAGECGFFPVFAINPE